MEEYGNVVTYKYNGTNKPAYECSNGKSGTIGSAHNAKFQWYDANKVYHNVSASDLTNTANSGEEITKLTNTYYYYDVDKETDLAKGTGIYNMLFGNDNVSYWLASSCFYGNIYLPGSGIREAFNGMVAGGFMIWSNGTNDYVPATADVRAVVRLSSDFNP